MHASAYHQPTACPSATRARVVPRALAGITGISGLSAGWNAVDAFAVTMGHKPRRPRRTSVSTP